MKRRKETVERNSETGMGRKGARDRKRMQTALKQRSSWTSPDSESDPPWRSVTPGLKNSPFGSQAPCYQG